MYNMKWIMFHGLSDVTIGPSKRGGLSKNLPQNLSRQCNQNVVQILHKTKHMERLKEDLKGDLCLV